MFSVLGGFVLGRRHNFHCPNPSTAKYLRPHKCLPQRRHSSFNPLRQFGGHIVRGLHRSVGKTVDPTLHTSLDVGEHRRSREGAPSQVCRSSEMGPALYHGVATRYVAICTPPFQRRPYRLSLEP